MHEKKQSDKPKRTLCATMSPLPTFKKKSMLNQDRYLDILLFYVKDPFQVGSQDIEPGWNQVVRFDQQYRIRRLSEKEFYGSFPVGVGFNLTRHLFANMQE